MPNLYTEKKEPVGFQPLAVPIPAQEYPVDRDVQNRWVTEEMDDEIQALKEKIYSSIDRVSFLRFMAELERCVEQFNTIFPQDTPYAVLWDCRPHKSRRWTTALISEKLITKPALATYFSLVDDPDTSSISSKPVVDRIVNAGLSNIVIFDDGCFSGMQIDLDISTIESYMTACVLQAKPGYDIEFTYTIVVPYMTNYAKQRFEKMRSKLNGRIHVITTQIMPTLDELLDAADFDIIVQKLGGKVGNCDYAQFVSNPHTSSIAGTGITLTYFDHHQPDHDSFAHFEPGLIPYIRRPYRVETSDYYHAEEIDYERQRDEGLPIV